MQKRDWKRENRYWESPTHPHCVKLERRSIMKTDELHKYLFYNTLQPFFSPYSGFYISTHTYEYY
uniref:Ovule protein n=1 Tax=Heterorhabditis bacteriophora TaxID=37862 RepID=A0A1I7XQG3_HETBA